jgi:hypothetical protein
MPTPMPARDALASLARKKTLPTNLSTAELRALDAAVRRGSLFSARNNLESVLEAIRATVGSVLSPRQITRADRVTPENPEGFVNVGFDPATARVAIRAELQRAGYAADPDKRGTIEDLASEQRLNLVVKTQTEMAQAWAYDRAGQDPEILDAFPAYELFRAESRDQERDWLERFRLAGEASGSPINDGWTITPEGRMAALKNHPIWGHLGSSELFPDGLDNDFEPFAFNSGMARRDVDRAEAMELGLIDRDTQIAPRLEPLELKAA